MQPQLLDLFINNPSFANFIPFNNEHLISSLQQHSSQFTHIVGALHSGKTHLLKAWVHSVPDDEAIFIDGHIAHNELRELASFYKYIAVDNIDKLTANGQSGLFDLFNKIKLNNQNNYLLTSSSNSLDTQLNLREDLKTRLLSGITLNLKALNDDDLLKAMAVFTTKEGITLGDAEQSYLINHYTRNIGELIQAIQHIAEAAVIKKRNITIPLIKEVLT